MKAQAACFWIFFWSYRCYLLQEDTQLQNELISYDLGLVSHLFPLF